MPQSEMEVLIKLQKETIESLHQLVDSQRLTIGQLTKSHEEQTAQLNQTTANLNETIKYLKKKLFACSMKRKQRRPLPFRNQRWRRLSAGIKARQRKRKPPGKRFWRDSL